MLAWMLAGALVAAGTVASWGTPADRDRDRRRSRRCSALWSVRQTAGLMLARRDFNARLDAAAQGVHRAPATTPTRARCGRCWRSGPTGRRRASGCRSPRASGAATTSCSSWSRCRASVEVHEAWVDTGPLLVVQAALGARRRGHRRPAPALAVRALVLRQGHARRTGPATRSRSRSRTPTPPSPASPPRAAVEVGGSLPARPPAASPSSRWSRRCARPDPVAPGRQRAVRSRKGISAFRNALRRGAAEFGSLWA